jgi:putative DNA primase/helicase
MGETQAEARGMSKRSIQDLLGDEPSPLETIQGAIETLGGDPGGDTANGIAFYEEYRETLCYVSEAKAWLAFNGVVWGHADADVFMQAFAAGRLQSAAEAYRIARQSGDEKAEERAKAAMAKAGMLFNDRRAQERALKSARPHMTIPAARFNRTPHLLGVKNGVLDLKRGKIVRAPAGELISKQMGCEYDPEAKAAMWDRFIAEVLPDDEERGFLQRAIGAALYGEVLDNGVVFMLGESGDNGKSVACNVLTRLFGSYCMIAGADLLLQTKHESETKRLYAGLSMGPRLVLINELPKHAVWDDKKLKDIASRDDLQARKLYGEIYQFTPTHHTFVRGNHAPGTQDNGDAFWKRIWPVTFDVQIPKARQIAGLDDKIAARELPGVLNWALQGAEAWRRAGEASGSFGRLVLPKSMREARERYRGKTDYLARWLHECTEDGDSKGTPRTELWRSYSAFCHACGLKSAGMDRAFYDELSARGFTLGKSDGVRVVRHLTLKGERFR